MPAPGFSNVRHESHDVIRAISREYGGVSAATVIEAVVRGWLRLPREERDAIVADSFRPVGRPRKQANTSLPPCAAEVEAAA